jgi:hypothetical protein
MQYDGEFVTSWDQVDLSKAQILVGDGSHAFRRALSMEADTSLLQVLTVDGLDGFANFGGGKSSADQGLPPPKNGGHQPSFTRIKHLTIQNGTVGTTVSVPLDTVGSNPALAASTTVNFAGSSKSTSSIDGDSSGSSGPTGNFALSIPKPGDLSTLGWQELPDTADYDVAVDFSSLNFRDIMYSFGKLKLAKPSLGLEFSGRNTVTGERMMGIGTTSCIAHKVKSTLRWVIPEGMTSEEAATVPVVYLTSAFCLFEKANLQEGQSVLIHAGQCLPSATVCPQLLFACLNYCLPSTTVCPQLTLQCVPKAPAALDTRQSTWPRAAAWRCSPRARPTSASTSAASSVSLSITLAAVATRASARWS